MVLSRKNHTFDINVLEKNESITSKVPDKGPYTAFD